MQQIVAICRAIDLSARVLILDEPTASLDTQEVEMLFTLMRQLRDDGVSLIFVTHFLDQVYAVSDRITVLRNGGFVGCRETRELPQIELVKMMLGRELEHDALHRAGRTLLSDKPVAAFEGFGKKGLLRRLTSRFVPARSSAWRGCSARAHGNRRGHFRHQTGRQRHRVDQR